MYHVAETVLSGNKYWYIPFVMIYSLSFYANTIQFKARGDLVFIFILFFIRHHQRLLSVKDGWNTALCGCLIALVILIGTVIYVQDDVSTTCDT